MPVSIPENFVSVAIPHIHGDLPRPALVTIGSFDATSGLVPQEHVDAVVEIYANTVGFFIDSAVTIGPGIGTVEIDPGSYATVEGTFAGAGGRSGFSVPPNVALIARKTTIRPGRAGRGRMFLPFAIPVDSVFESGLINDDYLDDINAALSDFITDAAAADVPLHLLHETGVPGGSVPTFITAMLADGRVGTQRRRVRG